MHLQMIIQLPTILKSMKTISIKDWTFGVGFSLILFSVRVKLIKKWMQLTMNMN